MAIFVPRFVRQLRDVLLTAPADGEVLTYDSADEKWKNEAGGGGGGVTDHGALTGLADDDHAQYQLRSEENQPDGYLGLGAAPDGLAPVHLLGFTQGETFPPVGYVLTSVGSSPPDDVGEWISPLDIGFAPGDAEYVVMASHPGGQLDNERILGAQVIMAGTFAALPAAETAGRLYFATDNGTLYRDTGAAWVQVAAAQSHAHAGEDITSGTVADARIAATIARDSEVAAGDATVQGNLDAHIADATDAHDASAVSFSPTGTIAATDVQAAIAEVASEAGGGGISPTLFDANTILKADADDTPVALTMGASTILARLAAGNIKAASVAEILTLLGAATDAEVATEIADQKRAVEIIVTDPNGSAITTGDGKAYFFVPLLLNGHNLVAAHAAVTTVSSSGLPTVQIANVTQAADMLTTKITIDASEFTSYTAATPPVIDAANDDVATGDLLRVDLDVAGTGAKGLVVILTFEAP